MALFERRKGRLIPTAQGLQLYAEADRIFRGLNRLERAIGDIRESHRDVLRVGVIPALSGRLLQEALAQLHLRHPSTELCIHVREAQFPSEWIEAGQLDILAANWVTDVHCVEAQPLMEKAEVVCLVPQGHALAPHDAITPELLVGQRYLTLADGNFLPARLQEVFEPHQVEVVSVAQVSAATLACRMVEAGLGVTILHPLVAADAGLSVQTRRVHPPVLAEFHAFYPPAQAARASTMAFFACLQRSAKGLLG